MTISERFTFLGSSPFSPWHGCRFVVAGGTYNGAEQSMMEQKSLGRNVRDVEAARWNAAARDIVFAGNWARFSQDERLRDALMATRGTTLVEASPHDTIWGIGLAETDPKALDRSTWRGTSRLGQVLTAVREAMPRHEAEGRPLVAAPTPPVWEARP